MVPAVPPLSEATSASERSDLPGLIGWEDHGDPPQDFAGLEAIAEGTAWVGGTKPQHGLATVYPGPKGNLVLNASTIFWSQGLSSPRGTCWSGRIGAGRMAPTGARSGSRRTC